MLRAAIYARMSTDKQSAASPEDQIRACRGYAEREEFEVVLVEQDAGVSGASRHNRPGLLSLFQRTHAWDVLIYNLDRTHENVLYTKDDWMVWLIDHTRAFSSNLGRPPVFRDNKIVLSDDFAAAVGRLDEATLQAELGDRLSKSQIRSLLKRRDQLLKDSDKELRKRAKATS